MTEPLATLLMPAHDEAALIGRSLRPLRQAVRSGAIRLIVIANGCSDATAARARMACPEALVIETPRAGKTGALNLGYAQAVVGRPVLCLDADLVTTSRALFALVAAIEAGASAAIGQMLVDDCQASSLVRAYQRAWALNPYFHGGKFGGLFALSPAAASRCFPLPEVTGDDEFIRRQLPPAEVSFVPDCRFIAQSPRSLQSLLATRRRALRGARQVARMGYADPGPAGPSFGPMLRASFPSLPRLADLLVFATVSLLARLALLREHPGQPPVWERDLTSRREEVPL